MSITSTEEIFNGELHFLSSVRYLLHRTDGNFHGETSMCFTHRFQRLIQNAIRHLKWSVLQM